MYFLGGIMKRKLKNQHQQQKKGIFLKYLILFFLEILKC
jgi:hypothetical protein